MQVVYNIFDQAPEDELFPVLPGARHRRHRARAVRRGQPDRHAHAATRRWPEGDWRNTYFTPANLADTLARVERLGPLVPDGMDLPELALRFILEHPAVSTTDSGHAAARHVERNLAASDAVRSAARLRDALRAHRWDRG